MKKIFVFLFLIVLAIGGCFKNPVATRTGQPPAGIVGTWETPASPEAVIRNLLFSYNEMFIQNFQSCLGENFYFSSPEDSIRAEAQGSGYLYYDWNKSVEISTAQNIFSTFNVPGRKLDLIMSESFDNPDSLGDTLAVVYREYILRSIVIDSLGADTTTMTGLATFRLSQAMLSFWTIDSWKDIPAQPGGLSWGQFKAMYRR